MSDDDQQLDDWKRDKSGRFADGTKPGPGRPPGRHTPSLMAALRRRFEESEGQDGRSIADDIAGEMVQRALNGDAKILAMLWDRLEGPVKQQIENDSIITIERIDPPKLGPADGDS